MAREIKILNEKEEELLEYMLKGYSNGYIADLFNYGQHTIMCRLSSIYSKFFLSGQTKYDNRMAAAIMYKKYKELKESGISNIDMLKQMVECLENN